MLIDFDRLNRSIRNNNVIDPIKIFDVLPEKHEKYDEYLRDVQSTVLDKWFHNFRENSNTVIKMNTGSGKTVIGLLILKSYLNDNKGPAVYFAPNNYLVKQVIKEAEDLGILVTDNARSPGFMIGEQILVTNMYKIINGRNVFGVNEIKQRIGCMVIDDAHACIEATKSQFEIKIPSDVKAYKEILNIFADSIKHQSEAKYLEIKDGEKGVQQLIPYWEWQEKLSEVTGILHEIKDDENYCGEEKSLYFNWPLIKDFMPLATCIITGDEIIITMDHLPINIIPSFDQCPHRVFMSATINDDSVLVSHFNIEQSEIEESITPKKANDIGERLILIPQEINPNIGEDNLKEYFENLAKKVNVVIIVPSLSRTYYWEDVASIIVKDNKQLSETLNNLHKSHVGLVVLINKYDGIDLPKTSCEVLVLDGIPDVRSEYQKYEEIAKRGSHQILKNTIQRIEQGMGRGIRSKDDYCVVFLMGYNLVNHLFNSEAEDVFTVATQVQLELSRRLFGQLEEVTLCKVTEIINYCLNRNTEWVEASRKALLDVKYNHKNSFDELVVKQREAFNYASVRDYHNAAQVIEDLANKQTNHNLQGYLKYKLAKYTHFTNQVKSHEIMMSAKNLNSQLLQPVDGIKYEKMQLSNLSQATKIREYCLAKYSSTNKYILKVKSIIDKLIFAENTSNEFEQAIKEIGEHLGLISQRPEREYGKGPDNLWGGDQTFLIIECKNGATTKIISKRDCNQLNGSIIWFEDQYLNEQNYIPIMIHPNSKFSVDASPNPKIKIMNEEKIDLFRSNLREFAAEVSNANYEVSTVSRLLNTYKLEPKLFVQKYTLPFTSQI